MTADFGTAHGVVLPVRVDPSGADGPTRKRAAGPHWRRSSRGLYVPSEVARTPTQRVAEVGVLLPPMMTPTGWAALAWHGGWWFSGLDRDGHTPLPVPVAYWRALVRPQSGFTLCRERWSPDDTVVVDGLPVATPVRAVCFAMRYADCLDDAVAALDLAAFHDLVSIEEASAWVLDHPSYTGIERARRALLLADENVWSPQENRMKTHLAAQNLGPFLHNHPVFDLNGRLLGTPDLLDPVAGVAVEYEGVVHLNAPVRARDLRREHDFRSHGLPTVSMVAADWTLPGAWMLRVRAAYAEARARPSSQRRWTIQLPDWWVPTFTVAQRRALDDQQRARLLHHRRPPTITPLPWAG